MSVKKSWAFFVWSKCWNISRNFLICDEQASAMLADTTQHSTAFDTPLEAPLEEQKAFSVNKANEMYIRLKWFVSKYVFILNNFTLVARWGNDLLLTRTASWVNFGL